MLRLFKRMPNPGEFLRAFNLSRHATIDASTLTVLVSAKIGHEVLQPYRKYKFPLSLTIKSMAVQPEAEQIVLNQVERFVSGDRVVYSQYGNPYNCYVINCAIRKMLPSVDRGVVIYEMTCEGYGDRV